MRKTKVRAIALLLVLVLLLATLSSCIYPGYSGPYPELCSVAWANLVEVRGYCSDGELSGDAEVKVIETDSYGRVLFSYFEREYYRDGDGGYQAGIYLVVMQSKDAEKVSYYPEDCYRFVKVDEAEKGDKRVYDPDVIEELKRINDWEKPFDSSKCDSTEIVTKKPDGKIKNGNKDAFLEGIVERYHIRSGRYISPKNISYVGFSRFVVADDYGRELWAVYTSFEEHTEKMVINYRYTFLIVLMPDGSCDESTVVLVVDGNNAQSEAKLIKEINNWNKPIE